MDHYFHSKLLTQQMEEGDRDVDDDGDDDDEPLSLFEYEDDNYHRYHDDDDAAIMLATENNDDLENSGSSEDDDDSNNSSSTTSSTTDDDGDDDNTDTETTPLQERRERNVRRNEQYMRDLKLGLNAMMVMRNDNTSIDSNGISGTARDANATAQVIMGGKNDGQRMRKSKSSSSSPSEAAHRMEDADGVIATDGKTDNINQRKRRRGMLFSKQASTASSTQPMDNIDGAGTSVSSSSQQQLPPPIHLFTAKSISNELECKYPHRSHQIRTLTSCLVNTVRKSEFAAQQSSSTSQYHFSPSASPIMITGGSGNGKTHLVCDAVEILRQRSNTTTPKDYNNTTTPKRKRSCTSLVTVATAYVDCASSECDSASSAMDCAYRQAHADYFHGITNVMNNHGGGIRRGRSPRGEKTKKTMTTTMNKKKSKQENVDGMAGSSMTRIGGVGGGADDQEEEEEEEEERMANDTNFGEGYILEQGDDEDFDDDEDSIVEDQLERQRKNRKLLHNNMKKKNAKRTMSSAMSHGNNNSRTTARRQSRIGRATNTETTAGSGGLMSKSPRIEGSTTNSTVQGGGGSVALFGRAISSFSIRNGGNSYGNSAPPPSRCCMFLILDNADRILSWRRYGSIHPLTQIVMLPSVMGIDLTLIFISQSSIFQYSRE